MAKSFVMEIADLQNDRRETTFNYGSHVDAPVAYNPGAFTWNSTERAEADRHELMVEALEQTKSERFLAVDGDVAYVADPNGLTEYLLKASEQRSSIVDQLAAGLVAWPVTQKGEAVEITRETLASVPFAFILAIYQAVMADMSPAKNLSNGRARARRPR